MVHEYNALKVPRRRYSSGPGAGDGVGDGTGFLLAGGQDDDDGASVKGERVKAEGDDMAPSCRLDTA